MSPELAKEIQSAQDHGRSKYGNGPDDLAHDDSHPPEDWHDFIEDHNGRASVATPTDRREHLVKVAGLACSAIEAHDRQQEDAKSST